jgi:hypothetical protein
MSFRFLQARAETPGLLTVVFADGIYHRLNAFRMTMRAKKSAACVN